MRVQTKQLGDVIPRPASVRPVQAVSFKIIEGTGISTVPEASGIGEYLAAELEKIAGHPIAIGPEGTIRLELDTELAAEQYTAEITGESVTVRGGTQQGLFWGVQTLLQLAPELPGGVIEDAPRYEYRGAMLDLARHFFTADQIREHIDLLVQFKINHLHLHLTDDQGWRLEIPGWPLLTEISGGPGTGVDGKGPGFLTLAEYADVVRYAASRFVTIVPEIDMPGHVNAVQYAYPSLTADGQPVSQRIDAEVGYSSLVAGMEETYAFVEDVIRAVADVTPGPYLHIGGDECLSTPPEDYRTFLARVLPLPAKYGKRVIGWHEIAAVEMPENAVVQYWRIEAADENTARAARDGHRIIMAPADRTYLDMKYDADTKLGLDWAGLVDVRRSYDWDPADRLPGVGEEALLGVEAPLWSETLRSSADAQYLTFPRLPAIAEVAWSPRESRDWESFRARVAAFGPRWDAAGIAYHRTAEIDWP